MKDQFVTYEIAKRLKELVFNEPCMAYYHAPNAIAFNPDGIMSGSYWNNTDDGSRMNGDSCAAPLWQQAIDWLWKEHEIWADAFPLNVNEIYRYKYNVSQMGETLHESTEYLATYEQTREAAILKALTLL